MSTFTQERQRDSLSVKTISVKVDTKGRISIPSFLRKNFGLVEGQIIVLVFDLKENFLVLGTKKEAVL